MGRRGRQQRRERIAREERLAAHAAQMRARHRADYKDVPPAVLPTDLSTTNGSGLGRTSSACYDERGNDV